MTKFAAVILAAGKGTRMKSDLPKVLHPVGNRSMVAHVSATAAALDADHVVVVTAKDMENVFYVAKETAPNAQHAVQLEQLGTGDAVKAAADALDGYDGAVIVLYGDTPLIRPETIELMIGALDEYGVVVLGMRPDEPGAYGRLVLGEDGSLEKIVEYKDATEDERDIDLCNSGVMAVAGGRVFEFLQELNNNNASGEYYLTDVPAIAAKHGVKSGVVEAEEEELIGVNARKELSIAEYIFQTRRREKAMEEGATLLDPETVYFSADTKLGRDVVIQPNVFFGPGVSVADGVEIRAFSHLEGAQVGSGGVVGPFARLRPGAVLAEDVRVGNFVEVKNSILHAGAKAGHLSYIGDAEIGVEANIGAGTITCNYDGFNKFKTTVGAYSFIGSDSTLVAPVSIGDGAFVAAGSCITDDVSGDALAIARERQHEKAGWAKVFREKKQ